MPSGDSPSGSATLHWGGGFGPTVTGPLTCLAVKGNIAVIGFFGRDSVALTPPLQYTMQITERAGHGPDTVLLQDPRIGGQAARSPSDCSSITQPTSRYNVDRGGVTAIFDARMPTNHECQAVEDINGLSVIRTRTVSCQSARAIVRTVNYIVLPVALFLYMGTTWSTTYIAATPNGQFRCQRRNPGRLEVRCRQGRAQVMWLMLG